MGRNHRGKSRTRRGHRKPCNKSQFPNGYALPNPDKYDAKNINPDTQKCVQPPRTIDDVARAACGAHYSDTTTIICDDEIQVDCQSTSNHNVFGTTDLYNMNEQCHESYYLVFTIPFAKYMCLMSKNQTLFDSMCLNGKPQLDYDNARMVIKLLGKNAVKDAQKLQFELDCISPEEWNNTTIVIDA